MSRGTPQYLLFYKNQYKGPYDESLLLEELSQKRVGRDALVWSEDSGRWSSFADTFAFNEYLDFLGDETKLSEGIDEKQKALQTVSAESADEVPMDKRIESDPYEKLRLRRISANRPLTIEVSEDSLKNLEVSQEKTEDNETPDIKKSIWLYLTGTLAVLLMAALTFFQLSKFSDKDADALLERIKGSYQELTLAKEFLTGRRDLKPFVLPEITSQGDLPRFRLFASLPDSSQVLLHFKGLKKTLVGAIHEEAFVDVIINDRTGGTPPVQGKSQKELSPGYYQVTLTCLNCSGGGLHPQVLSKSVPIGIGDISRYQRDLKDFHGLLRDQAASELIEINEMLTVLSDRLNKRSVGGADKIFSQVASLLESIDEDVARSDYVFGDVYLEMRTLAIALRSQEWEIAAQAHSSIQNRIPALKRSLRKSKFMD